MARPKKDVDERLIARLAEIHCTMKEISAVAGVSVDTLERRFADLIDAAREKGRESLRRQMWNQAMEGDVRLQIWLSKQHLGMREPKDEETMRAIRNVLEHRPYQTMPVDKLVKAIDVLSEPETHTLKTEETD